MLFYKDFSGQYHFDAEAEIFHGQIDSIKDVVTFQGKTKQEVEQAFIDSIEDYLEFCA